ICRTSQGLQQLYGEGLYLLACAQDRLDKREDAIDTYHTFCNQEINSTHLLDARYRLASLYYSQGNLGKVREVLSHLDETAQIHVPSALLLTYTELQEGRIDECRLLVTKLRLACGPGHQAYNEALFLEGVVALADNDVENGANYLEQARSRQQV